MRMPNKVSIMACYSKPPLTRIRQPPHTFAFSSPSSSPTPSSASSLRTSASSVEMFLRPALPKPPTKFDRISRNLTKLTKKLHPTNGSVLTVKPTVRTRHLNYR